jgi:hypothetical protein
MNFKKKLRGGGRFADEPQRIYKELRYFEEQNLLYCAVHAINNLAQMKLTNKEQLNSICTQLKLKDGQSHCSETGDYSVDVIVTYFRLRQIPVLAAVSTSPCKLNQCMNDIILNSVGTNSLYGFIVSNSKHWIAIRWETNSVMWIDSATETLEFLEYDIYEPNGLDALLRKVLSYYGNHRLLGFVVVFNPRSFEINRKYEDAQNIIENYLSFEMDMNLFPR